jgi:hypothetical protein
MNPSRSLFELGSDYFREAAVLVGVFGFLDKTIKEDPIYSNFALGIVAASASLFMLGYVLERLRRR